MIALVVLFGLLIWFVWYQFIPVSEWSIKRLASHCPNFYEDMPKEEDDKLYVAHAGINTVITSRSSWMDSDPIKGIRNAYIEARRLGVIVERRALDKFGHRMSAYADGSYPNSIGIYWSLGEFEEADPENDEFECDVCHRIGDIEDSIRVGKDGLVCDKCAEEAQPKCSCMCHQHGGRHVIPCCEESGQVF